MELTEQIKRKEKKSNIDLVTFPFQGAAFSAPLEGRNYIFTNTKNSQMTALEIAKSDSYLAYVVLQSIRFVKLVDLISLFVSCVNICSKMKSIDLY